MSTNQNISDLGISQDNETDKEKLIFIYFNTEAFPEVLNILTKPKKNCTENKQT